MKTIYDFEAVQMNGQDLPLSQLQGKVMLIVNTASACGFTPQFGGLENNIYDGAILIIPFPLLPSLQDYKAALENHFYYYGR